MAHVKTAFGFVILALPVFTGADYWQRGLRLWSLLGVAFFGWAFITSLPGRTSVDAYRYRIILRRQRSLACGLQDWRSDRHR